MIMSIKTIEQAVNFYKGVWPDNDSTHIGWEDSSHSWFKYDSYVIEALPVLNPIFTREEFKSYAINNGQPPEMIGIDLATGPDSTVNHEVLEITPKTAIEFLNDCIDVQSQRGKEYQGDDNERSFQTVADAFNTITGRDLKASDICLILTTLKLVRQYSDPNRLHADSLLDGVSYMSLWAEELTRECNHEEK